MPRALALRVDAAQVGLHRTRAHIAAARAVLSTKGDAAEAGARFPGVLGLWEAPALSRVDSEWAERLRAEAAVREARMRTQGLLDVGGGREGVALTFDDGPDPHHTPGVLEGLARYAVKATFFCVGLSARAHPDLLVAISDAGHVIGNHTWSHPFLRDLEDAEIAHQLRASNNRRRPDFDRFSRQQPATAGSCRLPARPVGFLTLPRRPARGFSRHCETAVFRAVRLRSGDLAGRVAG